MLKGSAGSCTITTKESAPGNGMLEILLDTSVLDVFHMVHQIVIVLFKHSLLVLFLFINRQAPCQICAFPYRFKFSLSNLIESIVPLMAIMI